MADCIPIFLFDKRNHYFGLVHAGWRGVALGIVENTIKKFLQFNSIIKDIKILLGPSIRQCCFEVGPEVGKKFENKFLTNGKKDKLQLDLQRVVINKFITGGISKKNIKDLKECTHCSEKYYSYRRDGEKTGRMIAMMGHRK